MFEAIFSIQSKQQRMVAGRAADSESRPELESAGVDRFGWSRSWSWSRSNFADSDSGLESQANTRQQVMILD